MSAFKYDESQPRPRGRPPKVVISESPDAPETSFQRVYWATAKGHQIANFRKEIKSGGQIIQSEVPLRFLDHIFSTENPAEIEFIENSSSFKNGRVRRVKDLAEAYALTATVKRSKQIRTVESSSVDEGYRIYQV